jgi:hypothetical protein
MDDDLRYGHPVCSALAKIVEGAGTSLSRWVCGVKYVKIALETRVLVEEVMTIR